MGCEAMRKKVVFIAEALGGGVRRHLVDLLENLNKDFYEIYVIYGSRTDSVFLEKMNILKEEGIVFYEVRSMVREISFKMDFKAFQEIYQILKQVKPDIVHCHSSKAGAIGRICAKLLGVKQIYYTPHAYSFMDPNISKKKKYIYMGLEKMLSGITNKVIHVSVGEEKEAIECHVIHPNKSKVIYNGIYEKIDGLKEFKSNKQFIIGTVARMDRQKNPMEFIKIAESIISSNSNVIFVYVGDGEKFKEVQNYVKNSTYKNNIILTGFHKKPCDVLQTFDLFLTTSLYEGLPYSLIEALMFGLPIIATNVTGNNEVVINEYNGYLYQQGNIKEAVNFIEMLINEPRELNRLSNNSYHLYHKKFMLGKMINSYDFLYKNVKKEKVS